MACLSALIRLQPVPVDLLLYFRRPSARITCQYASLSLGLAVLMAAVPAFPPAGMGFQGAAARQRILVDDFERTDPENALGKRPGAFADPKGLGYCYVFFTAKEDQTWGGKGHSLYLKFETSKPGSWGGYWTDLNHLNLKESNFLTFYLKGLQGGEQFKVGLRGERESERETKLLIGEVLAGGVTTEWQKVSIPLRLFQEIRNWDDVNILSFSFEFAAGSRSGAVLIDEIAFEK